MIIGPGSVARGSKIQSLEATLLTPVRITIIYILFGSLWILFSDATLHALVNDPETENRLQTVKGWFYVLVTGGLVFWLTRALSASLEAENRERRRAEAELRNALESAEQASQAKTEFLATMSHEFRTPLNAILGFSDILRAQHLGPLGAPKYAEYVDDIHQSGAIMLALVNDILDIAEIEAGKRPIHRAEIALKPLADACLKSFQPQAEEKSITLVLDMADDALRLYADQICAIQIMSNLIANAIKYTGRGGTVALAAAPAPDRGTALTVRDNGIGIPPDKLPTIAEPFSQVIASPHLARDGKGLGLAIVKSLVDAHDGDIDIDSILGEGTTVTVRFPPPLGALEN
ncbi:MAG TPA: hypothetical protein DC046_00925 [Rhodospirillaceae bacterium]|nr:hypothetical protein [Rhodospirillaceae bacterium]